MTGHRVVGTLVESAQDDDRLRTILISDLHIPEGGGPAHVMFCELLSAVEDPAQTRLIVLGDLFDFYTGPRQNEVGVWREVAQALAAAVERGLSVTLLHGNRDFMLDAAFAELGRCRVVAGGLQIALDDQPCLLLHGDELCQRDLPYQRAKRLLRHPMTRAILRCLPLSLSMRLAQRARDRSATVIASGDQTRFDPTAGAMREVFDGGAASVVFGHIHRPARGRFEASADSQASGDYAILPAFDETGVYLWHADGALRYRHVADGNVADYPAREFC